MPETTSPETTTTAPTTTAPPAGDCPVGEWRLREQAYLEELAVLTTSAPNIDFSSIGFEHAGGSYRVTLAADGNYVGRRDSWQIKLTAPSGNILTTIDSTDEGTWSTEGDRITITDPGSPATVRVQIEIGGVFQDAPLGSTQTVGAAGISGTGDFSCDGGVLTVTVDELPDLPADTTLTAIFDPA